MAEDKKADLKFDRDELLSDDMATADAAREKRNSPLPEKYRDDPSKAYGFPIPEDRKPAVMPADTVESLDYKLATYSDVDDKQRKQEVEGTTGDVALAAFADAISPGDDANKVIAPPTTAAETAASSDAPTPTTGVVSASTANKKK